MYFYRNSCIKILRYFLSCVEVRKEAVISNLLKKAWQEKRYFCDSYIWSKKLHFGLKYRLQFRSLHCVILKDGSWSCCPSGSCLVGHGLITLGVVGSRTTFYAFPSFCKFWYFNNELSIIQQSNKVKFQCYCCLLAQASSFPTMHLSLVSVFHHNLTLWRWNTAKTETS
jgi:hypothetical protein